MLSAGGGGIALWNAWSQDETPRALVVTDESIDEVVVNDDGLLVYRIQDAVFLLDTRDPNGFGRELGRVRRVLGPWPRRRSCRRRGDEGTVLWDTRKADDPGRPLAPTVRAITVAINGQVLAARSWGVMCGSGI